jgi:hypothetical protein
MEGWNKIQNSFAAINLAGAGASLNQGAGRFTKGLNSTLQQAKGPSDPRCIHLIIY